VLFRNYSIIGLYVGAYRRNRSDQDLMRSIHADVFRLIETGQVIPLIDRVVPLAEAPAALRAIEERRVTGKALVAVRS
jgi:NADPH:quinone reductase-like Zn-dependent oxidoreductase